MDTETDFSSMDMSSSDVRWVLCLIINHCDIQHLHFGQIKKLFFHVIEGALFFVNHNPSSNPNITAFLLYTSTNLQPVSRFCVCVPAGTGTWMSHHAAMRCAWSCITSRLPPLLWEGFICFSGTMTTAKPRTTSSVNTRQVRLKMLIWKTTAALPHW